MPRYASTLLKSLLSALACGALFAPAALAEEAVFWNSSLVPGQSSVAVTADAGVTLRLELYRDDKLLAKAVGGSPYGFAAEIPLESLRVKDTVKIYRNGAQDQFQYTGAPWFGENACAGRSSFTSWGYPSTKMTKGGAYRPGPTPTEHGSTFQNLYKTTVWLDRKLTVGDVVYATATERTRYMSGPWVNVNSYRQQAVAACDPPELEEQPDPVKPVPPKTDPIVGPPVTVDLRQRFTSALGDTGSQLGKLSTAKLARSARITLKVATPTAGTTKLRLTSKAKRKTVLLGTGTTRSTKVVVKLTKPGRTLLKRAKRVKVTLAGTFTASTPGAKPITQRRSVTIKR